MKYYLKFREFYFKSLFELESLEEYHFTEAHENSVIFYRLKKIKELFIEIELIKKNSYYELNIELNLFDNFYRTTARTEYYNLIKLEDEDLEKIKDWLEFRIIFKKTFENTEK